MRDSFRRLGRWALLLLPLLAVPGAAAKPLVVSLTFDDGWKDQTIARGIMDERGFKGTFYIITGAVGWPGYLSKADVQSLQAGGHEVGGHTVDHVDLVVTTGSERVQEICDNRATLMGWGLSVVSFAYPFGHVDADAEKAVQECGFTNARRVGGLSCPTCPKAGPLPPPDPFDIYTPDSIKTDSTPDGMMKIVQAAEKAGGWVPLVLHHICDDCDLYATSASSFTAFADWLKQEADAGRVVVQTVAQAMGSAPPPPPPPPDNPAPSLASVSPSSATAGGPALTLTVDGSGFVSGSAVRWNGSFRKTTYVDSGTLLVVIPADDLDSPGTAAVTVHSPGPGGGTSGPAVFRILPAANPAPSLASVSPSSATAGGPGLTLTITGSGFARAAAVLWNGSARETVYVSPTRLTARLLPGDLAGCGDFEVSVANAGPGGGASGAVRFTVVPASPPPERIVSQPDLSLARVRPNPWRADRHPRRVVFDQLPPGSTVEIFTASAHWMKTLQAPGGSAVWDLTNDSGEAAASGFYIYLVIDERKEKRRGVLGVIR